MEELKNEMDSKESNSSESPAEENSYLLNNYTLYGGSTTPQHIKLKETLDYLHKHEHRENPLKKARYLRDLSKENVDYLTDSEARKCTFCLSKISGVIFDRTADGRLRCSSCSRSLIKSEEQLKEVFEDVKNSMETFYNIRFATSIKTEMVNQIKVKRREKKDYPQSETWHPFFVEDKKGVYTISVDNAMPYLNVYNSLANALTYVWVKENWNKKELKKKYNKKLRNEMIMGFACWSGIQLLYLLGERKFAKKLEMTTALREDEMGDSFVRFLFNYPLVREGVSLGRTPFARPEEPLNDDFCQNMDINREELLKYYENI